MYDIIIIGGGPAGLTASIYAKEANKSVLLLEKMVAGGQVAPLVEITNYPGFEKIDGFELSSRMKKQALNLGVEFKTEEVISADFLGEEKIVNTHKNTYTAKNVIIASGAFARPLDVENEKFYFGKGLSYCATCDGSFFKGKTVAVVGGGNSSINDVIYLSNLASKVYLIHRREEFRASAMEVDKVKAMPGKVEILTNTVVQKINGQSVVESIDIYNKLTDTTKTLKIDGLFVAIGRKPDTGIFSNVLNLDKNGFIVTDEFMRTNIKGVYAIGDVRTTPLRQIVTACADGAIAVSTIIKNS